MAAQGGTGKRKKKTAHSERVCKLVLVGDMNVGKTCLVLRFIKGTFHESPGATLGVAFSVQSVDLDDTTVKFEIWDTAGEEKFHSLTPIYYRGAQAAIVVYDITNNESFIRARSWVQELQRYAKPNIVIALAGNKADLAGDRILGFEVAQLYADENGLLFMETSAKTDMNVDDIFLAIAKKLPKSATGRQQSGGSRELQVSGQGNQRQSRRGGGCCKN